MQPWWLAITGIGVVILAWSVAVARHPRIGHWEQEIFHAINGLPGWLYPVVWLPMQLGNLVVGTAAGLAIAYAANDFAVGVGVLLAAGLKLVGERLIREHMAPYLIVRQRPGTSQVGAILRGPDVPASGASFPSGHVILVAAVGAVVAPILVIEWWALPLVLTSLVMIGRVYVGAHNPVDVTAGLGAGLALGGIVAMFVP